MCGSRSMVVTLTHGAHVKHPRSARFCQPLDQILWQLCHPGGFISQQHKTHEDDKTEASDELCDRIRRRTKQSRHHYGTVNSKSLLHFWHVLFARDTVNPCSFRRCDVQEGRRQTADLRVCRQQGSDKTPRLITSLLFLTISICAFILIIIMCIHDIHIISNIYI